METQYCSLEVVNSEDRQSHEEKVLIALVINLLGFGGKTAVCGIYTGSCCADGMLFILHHFY